MLAYRSARRGWLALAATVLLAVLLTLVIALPRGAAPPPPTVPGNPTGAQPGPAAPGDTLTRSRDRSGGGLAGASAQRTFLVTVNHRPDQCEALMRAVLAAGDDEMKQWWWGCPDNRHMAYRLVRASTEAEAIGIVPENFRGEAEAFPVTTMSRGDVNAMYPPPRK